MTDPIESLARKLAPERFGSSWAGLTDWARRLALAEARGIFAIVTPIVLEEACERVRALQEDSCVGAPCATCAAYQRALAAIREWKP